MVREKVDYLIREKNELEGEIEKYKVLIIYEERSQQRYSQVIIQLDEKINVSLSATETESLLFSSVQEAIKQHKENNNAKEREIMEIFSEIDLVLS
jgi:hypothetical protein